jgi:hypothetical protein
VLAVNISCGLQLLIEKFLRHAILLIAKCDLN